MHTLPVADGLCLGVGQAVLWLMSWLGCLSSTIQISEEEMQKLCVLAQCVLALFPILQLSACLLFSLLLCSLSLGRCKLHIYMWRNVCTWPDCPFWAVTILLYSPQLLFEGPCLRLWLLFRGPKVFPLKLSVDGLLMCPLVRTTGDVLYVNPLVAWMVGGIREGSCCTSLVTSAFLFFFFFFWVFKPWVEMRQGTLDWRGTQYAVQDILELTIILML